MDNLDPDMVEFKDEDELSAGEEFLRDDDLEAELEALEQEEKHQKSKKSTQDTEMKKAQATAGLQNTLLNCQKNFIHRQRGLDFLNQ
jgi:hypothetical protein